MAEIHPRTSPGEASEALEDVIRGHLEGTLTRREAIVRATALGLSISGIAGILADSAVAATNVRSGNAAGLAPVRGGTYTEGYFLQPTKLNTVHGPFAD